MRNIYTSLYIYYLATTNPTCDKCQERIFGKIQLASPEIKLVNVPNCFNCVYNSFKRVHKVNMKIINAQVDTNFTKIDPALFSINGCIGFQFSR